MLRYAAACLTLRSRDGDELKDNSVLGQLWSCVVNHNLGGSAAKPTLLRKLRTFRPRSLPSVLYRRRSRGVDARLLTASPVLAQAPATVRFVADGRGWEFGSGTVPAGEPRWVPFPPLQPSRPVERESFCPSEAPLHFERRRLRHGPLLADTRGHEAVPGWHARASTNAGLVPCRGTHLLLAPSRTEPLSRRHARGGASERAWRTARSGKGGRVVLGSLRCPIDRGSAARRGCMFCALLGRQPPVSVRSPGSNPGHHGFWTCRRTTIFRQPTTALLGSKVLQICGYGVMALLSVTRATGGCAWFGWVFDSSGVWSPIR